MSSPKPDSSDVDAALVAMLLNDSQLRSLMPDGVFFDVASAGAKRFVLVSLLDGSDEWVFGGRAIEDKLYLVKAVALAASGGNIKAAAARIDALLEGTSPEQLQANGYTLMDSVREEPVRYTEVDPDDADVRWLHRGGHYRVRMTLGM